MASASRINSAANDAPEQTPSLRERKRRALRRRLSDTATLMFLEHGFDSVRVADVAKACGVSTKTVWNHFSSKESLLFDRGEALAETLRQATQQQCDVLAVVVSQIHAEIEHLDNTGIARLAVGGQTLQMVRAFTQLVQQHPGLRAAMAGRVEELNLLAATAVATQWGCGVDTPETQIAGAALVTLWRIHLGALLRCSETAMPPGAIRLAVLSEVDQASGAVGRVIDALAPH